MSLSKFESEVKHLPQAQEAIYARFADLRNLESLKQRINDPALEEKLSSGACRQVGRCSQVYQRHHLYAEFPATLYADGAD